MRGMRHRYGLHPLLLLGWFTLGLGLRLSGLTLKAPWTDEILTLIYSGGQDLRSFPLDQLISLETLLAWLHLNPSAGAAEITQRIFGVSVHPPLYFIGAHAWMALFDQGEELLSLSVARLLPALLGSALVPAAFGLGWLAWRSRRTGHLAAALMAVSPYGIYLSPRGPPLHLGDGMGHGLLDLFSGRCPTPAPPSGPPPLARTGVGGR